MFTTVKNLTYLIDNNISYVLDAKEHHSCSDEEYENYLDNMKNKLFIQIKKLEEISCNKKLIETYTKKSF